MNSTHYSDVRVSGRGHSAARRRPSAKLPLAAGLATAGLVAGVTAPAVASEAASRPQQASAAISLGPRIPALHWRACDNGFQCGTARVPLNYRHPRGRLISIAVLRHVATGKPAGTLFVNGGGPAEQIQGFLAAFPAVPAPLRQRFNIVTFDPRGFGFSSDIRCFRSVAAEDKVLGPALPYPTFPVGARQTRTFERIYARFDAACVRHAGELLYHDTTADVARDMNLLRQAVGAPRLNYIGLSYGTGLGAVYANLFPATVGRMVLDGNLNPVAWTRGGAVPSFVRQGDGPNEAVQTQEFLSLCGKQPVSACAFSAGSPAATRAKFGTLLTRLRARPVQVGGQSVGFAGVFMIVPPGDVSEWQPAAAQLQALWAASAGQAANTSRPDRLAGASPYSGLEQSLAVLCADTADPRYFRDYIAAAQDGSRFGGFGQLAAWMEAPCARWPRATEQDRYAGPWNRRTADTILVIGNTGDPATRYENSVSMAHDLARARLLTVKGFGHTEFFNPSACAGDYELRYLLTGALPPAGTICPQSVEPFPSK